MSMIARLNFLKTVDWFNLNTCIQPICRIFGYQVFLVGSCLTRKDYRDVDVRVILSSYEGLLGHSHHRHVIGMIMSEWLANRTGLPIDLQLQTTEEADKFTGPRNAIGITI